MNVKIADLMSERVIVAEPHHTVAHVRGLMERNKIHAVPIVGTEDEPLGIVSSVDLRRANLGVRSGEAVALTAPDGSRDSDASSRSETGRITGAIEVQTRRVRPTAGERIERRCASEYVERGLVKYL